MATTNVCWRIISLLFPLHTINRADRIALPASPDAIPAILGRLTAHRAAGGQRALFPGDARRIHRPPGTQELA